MTLIAKYNRFARASRPSTERTLTSTTVVIFRDSGRTRLPHPLLKLKTRPSQSRHGPTYQTLANELWLDVDFLENIQTLLEDKLQVIFQGPPGTGKTYVAQKLAESSRRFR